MILLIVCLSFCSTVSAQIVDILKTYYSNVSPGGDVKEWNKIKSYYTENRSYFSVNTFQKNGQLPEKQTLSFQKNWWLAPHSEKNVLYSDSAFSNITSRFYYVKNMRTIYMANLPRMEAKMEEQMDPVPLMPLKIERIIKESTNTVYNGVVKVPGVTTQCHEITVSTKRNFDPSKLYFNTETGLLESLYFPNNDTYWMLSKYKRIDGYLIPMFIVWANDQGLISWDQVDTIKLNLPIDKKEFDSDI